MAPVKINEFIALNSFKKEIRNWVPQNCPWRLRKQYISGVGFIFRVLAIYILHIYIYIYIYICIIYIYIYIIYIYIYLLTDFMKNFQIKLVYTNKKTFSLTNYLLRITFFCYLFVLGTFVTFFL